MQRLKGKQLFFNRQLVTSGRVIIIDLAIDKERLLVLEALEDMTLVFPEILSETLRQMLEPELDGSDPELLVFPGNGGCKVRQLCSRFESFRQTTVPAKRVWNPGSDPTALVGGLNDRRLLIFEKKVVVVDDVISSGATLRLVHERNSWRTPRASWIAASWLSQSPRKGYPLDRYERIYTALLVENPLGQRVPINSLSTLVENEEIAADYARRSGYGQALLELVGSLR